MPETSTDLTLFVEQMAAIVNLPLQPEHQPGVIENVARIQTLAQLVMEFPLPEDIEPTPIFHP
jgi:hypothetical protein